MIDPALLAHITNAVRAVQSMSAEDVARTVIPLIAGHMGVLIDDQAKAWATSGQHPKKVAFAVEVLRGVGEIVRETGGL